MKHSANDIYDLNTSSPQGHVGFEPFRTDKHFYFHFNDAAGDCILFSQAYKTKKGCDNGIVSIKKNIKKKEHLIVHNNDDLHYFTIKAGNNQEVARSRNYESKEEMAVSIQYLYQQLGVSYLCEPKVENSQQIIKELNANLSEQTTIESELREKIWELETTLAETSNSLNESLLQKENWASEKTTLEEKMVLLSKKLSDIDQNKNSHVETKDALEEIPNTNFSFRINFYNVDNSQDIKMAIYHPISKSKEIIQGFDKAAMIDFMVSKLPDTVLPSMTDSIEKELDATKITETVLTSRSTPAIVSVEESKETTIVAEVQEEPILEAAPSKKIDIKPEKVKTIYQMKAFVEAVKRTEVPIIKVDLPPVKSVEPIELTEESTVEESAIIEQFFSQETKATTPIKKKTSTIPQPVKIEEVNAQEEKIVQQFFPNVEEVSKESEIAKKTPLAFLDTFISKNEEKSKSPIVEVLDITLNTQVKLEESAEKALVEQFFPQTEKSNQESATAIQIDIEKVLNKISKESEETAIEEVNIINKFFSPSAKKETAAAPTPFNFDAMSVDSITEDQQEDRESIHHFFGIKSEPITKKSSEILHNEIIDSILSHLDKETVKAPKDNETINKFFGKKSQTTTRKDSRSQTANTNTNEEDIRLFNKLFGKNIPINRSVSYHS